MQLTPPGSPASIHFREDKATMAGTARACCSSSTDIEAAREELIGHGVDVDEIWHFEPGKGPAAGRRPRAQLVLQPRVVPRPGRQRWDLQELTERLPGRGGATDGASRAELLLETALAHGGYEAVAPPHDWWDWYGAYMDAREQGSEPDAADATADAYMAEVKGVVVPA